VIVEPVVLLLEFLDEFLLIFFLNVVLVLAAGLEFRPLLVDEGLEVVPAVRVLLDLVLGLLKLSLDIPLLLHQFLVLLKPGERLHVLDLEVGFDLLHLLLLDLNPLEFFFFLLI